MKIFLKIIEIKSFKETQKIFKIFSTSYKKMIFLDSNSINTLSSDGSKKLKYFYIFNMALFSNYAASEEITNYIDFMK